MECRSDLTGASALDLGLRLGEDNHVVFVQVLPMVLPWAGLVLPVSGEEAGLAAGADLHLSHRVTLNSTRPSWKNKVTPDCYGKD